MERYDLIMKRKKARLSRPKLAKILNISESTVEKVEKGIRRPSPDLARKWAVALNIRENEIWTIFFNNEQDNMSGKVCCKSNNPVAEPHDDQAATLEQAG